MNWSAFVLTSVSSDTEPTIILNFDTAKYVFNIGENTNRAFLQSQQKWKKTRALFLTQLGTQRTGGLPGQLMTFADSGSAQLKVVGPAGTLHLLASMRTYLFRATMRVDVIEAQPVVPSSPEPIYKDGNITVYGIPLLPSFVTEQDIQLLHPDDVSLKRKRSPTPDLPSKRAVIVSEEEGSDPTLDQMMSTPGFSPRTLSGILAQDWRSSMLNAMFPAHKKHVNLITSGKKKEEKLARQKEKGKGKSEVSVDAPKLDPDQELSGDIDSYKRASIPKGYNQHLPAFSYSGTGTPDAPPTLAYVVVGPRMSGRFDAKRAQELGIPNGPMRSKLTKGETITFKRKIKKIEDGTVREIEVERTVRPEECVGESDTPVVVLILDVPSPAYIPSLLSSFDEPFFAKFKSRSPEHRKEHVVRSIYHILGEGVLEDERYLQFMRSFEEDDDAVHHLVASREYCPDPVTFTSAAFNQLRLNQLDERIFTIPKFSLQPAKDISAIQNLPRSVQPMVANQMIPMRPFRPPIIETPEQDNFHPTIKSNEPIPLPPWTARKFKAAKESVDRALKRSRSRSRSTGSVKSGSGSESDSAPSLKRGRDVGVLPLGTGSAAPTKYRNVSSTLISIPDWGNILLDAGEGTWGQLVRQYGLGQGPKAGKAANRAVDPGVWQILRDLRCIFISHIHGDHHIGVATILAKRKLLDPPPSDPLYLVGTRSLHSYLRELSDLQNLGIAMDPAVGIEKPSLGSDVVTVMSEALHWTQPDAYHTSGLWQIGGIEPWLDLQRSKSLAIALRHSLGLRSFETVDMDHRTKCYGLVMKHLDEWSIAFSGDTLPVNTFASVATNATLLIHEATMADDDEALALQRAHSTFKQAISIGKTMEAEHILLTHFSARYPKIPPIEPGTAMPDDDPATLDYSNKQDSWGRAQTPPGAIARRRKPVIAVAFDHLNMTIGEMWKINHYLPAIEQSFLDTLEEGDDQVDESGAQEVA